MSFAARISGSGSDTSAESDGLAFGVVRPGGETESLAEEEGAPDDACGDDPLDAFGEEEGLMRRGGRSYLRRHRSGRIPPFLEEGGAPNGDSV